MKPNSRIMLWRICSYVLTQAQQPSTWRGIALLASVMGAALKPEQHELIVLIGLGVAGLIGAIFPDAKK